MTDYELWRKYNSSSVVPSILIQEDNSQEISLLCLNSRLLLFLFFSCIDSFQLVTMITIIYIVDIISHTYSNQNNSTRIYSLYDSILLWFGFEMMQLYLGSPPPPHPFFLFSTPIPDVFLQSSYHNLTKLQYHLSGFFNCRVKQVPRFF